MPTAYVLLNTEIGAENQVLKELRRIEGVQEAHGLWGVYDVIANVKAETVEKLRYIINKKIGQVGRINTKLTMLITENAGPSLDEQVFFASNTVDALIR